ncbi:MAG: hypothetical protein IJI41_02180 [Anaerolineaceae bacterium]|nr:hypothetical protein [Anaerolineaceae bacterium]
MPPKVRITKKMVEDVFSKFAVPSETVDKIYVIVSIILSAAYSIYLWRLKDQAVV